jgi:prepilin peptidase CpaA
MTLADVASLTACLIFVAAMLHVIVTDLRYRRIRNWLVAGLAAAYLPFALLCGMTGAEITLALVAALLVFAAGFGAFAAGWVGGGDVKLAAVVALWLGAQLTLPFLVYASLFGGALALALLAGRALLRRTASGTAPEPEPSRLALPYGPALALAGLVLLSESSWIRAL